MVWCKDIMHAELRAAWGEGTVERGQVAGERGQGVGGMIEGVREKGHGRGPGERDALEGEDAREGGTGLEGDMGEG